MSAGEENLARRVFRDPVHVLAFGFGTGLSPVAPGTAGSLLGVALAWISFDAGMTIRLGIAAGLVVAGVWICGVSARRLGIHDYGGIVWDEIAGMYVTLLVAPPLPADWLLGFGLFRAFDIVKPWPIRDLDHRIEGGTGIMLDDLVAALYAASILAFFGWLAH